MPVKNIKRKTNDGFEGVITGLNDKEKEIIAKSVGGSDEIIEANGTFMTVEEETGTIINTLSFDNDIAQKIKEGKIKVICGYLQNFEADNDPDYFYCTLNRIQDAQTNYPTCYYRQEGNDLGNEIFTYAISISFSDEEPSCTAMLAKLKNGNLTPSLPSDASSKNYTLEANNGTIAWTESGGGGGITKRTLTIPKSELSLGGDLTEAGEHKALVLSETARANFVSFIEGSSIETCILVKLVIKTNDESFTIALNLNKSFTDYGLSYIGSNIDFVTLADNSFYLFVNDTFDKNVAYFQKSASYFDGLFNVITELEINEYII